MLGKRKPRLIKKRVKFKGKWRINKEVVVKDEGVSPLVKKYWVQRYDLFLRYDQGIKMDEEGWFSVTPEKIARRHARRCGGGVVIDGFAGVGGNAIQFATMCHHVIAIDIDPRKIALAFENAKIYGVEDHIEFIVGDFFQLAPSLKGNVVFLSPPWGGPAYCTKESFTLDLLKPKNGYSLFQVAQSIAPNVIMYLPRNVDLLQVEELSWLSSPPLKVEVVVMRVSLHCQGCAGKVKKHLSKMEGVTSFSIELDSKRVTVMGHVSPVGVLESVSKVKRAEFWPINSC